MIKLSDVQTIHIVGIGGISNSAIAEILISKGFRVTGSDLRESAVTERLRKAGIPIAIGHDGAHLLLSGNRPDLVAYTAAIDTRNPEIRDAMDHRIPLCSRAELLGALMEQYPHSIAVSGTHGKTSTTSMINHLLEAHTDTTALVGGFIHALGSNVKIGTGDVLITEACEYKDSFLSFRPEIGVILNIDEDHLDYFSGIDPIIASFRQFAQGVRRTLIVNADDPHTAPVLQDSHSAATITFGMNVDADLRIADIDYDDKACPRFRLIERNGTETSIALSVPGKHNVYNAAAAFGVALAVLRAENALTDGLRDELAGRLSTFQNADRRFQHIGIYKGATVVDDYAHHPNEIAATIAAAKQMKEIRRILILFQPHTFTRTKQLLSEFGTAFRGADLVILSDIYAAREPNLGEVHARDVVRAIRESGTDSEYGGDIENTAALAESRLHPGDLLITMGAGDIDRVHKLWFQQKA
ncbi:MAG: UDP-N-acetylmuramate--L-alanine ligase [Bacillota bacterium]|nr:UDP-N-acetylmuramate--L-alanine ligase [Bacillota bacterium]